ncbi:MAG TPA: hypothetical protein VKK81_14510 [Candidatus Binatia bacterium]|nr:hypothetical protein [Candidatus Binatia bacterium]
MDEAVPFPQDEQTKARIIRRVADYLRQHPEELIDAKRVLRRFRASAQEFYQALLVLDRQPSSQASLGD